MNKLVLNHANILYSRSGGTEKHSKCKTIPSNPHSDGSYFKKVGICLSCVNWLLEM